MRAQERAPLWNEGQLVFLVGRVDGVVGEAEADQQAVHAEFALERADHRDRAARADQRRRLAPFGLQRAPRAAHRLAARRQRDRRAGAVGDELRRDVGRQPRLDEGAEALDDPLRVLLADQPERHFGARLGRQHRLRALADIAADDAVDVAGRARPDHLQRRAALLAGGNREADLAEERLLVEIEVAPLLGDLVGQLLDPVVEAGQSDRAVGVVQVGEDARQHADRVDRRAAVDAGMEVAVGGLDRHFLEHEAAQHGGDRRRLRVPHLGVADERQIGLQRLGVGGEEGGQRGRAGLLLALEQDGDVAGQAAIGAEGAAGLEEGHQLAFVVAGAAGDDALAARSVGEPRLERRRRPKLERVGRLDVVMAVEQHVRRVAGLGLRRRRRPSAGRRCRGAPPRSRDRRARAPASRRRGRNRRNGREWPRPRGSPAARTGDPARALVGVDRREHVFERGHAVSGAPQPDMRGPAAFGRASSRRGSRLQLGRAAGRLRDREGGAAPPAPPFVAQKMWRKRKYSVPESRIAAGSVSTQASAMLRSVDHWMPEPLAAIVPATPDDSTWVVETGRPRPSAAPIVARGDDLGRRALAVGQVRLADLLADGDRRCASSRSSCRGRARWRRRS